MNNIDYWNTGRMYTASGQRIAAVMRDDGSIDFADIDRQIFGTIPAGKKNPANGFDIEGYSGHLKSFVMAMYDQNEYDCACPDEILMRAAKKAAPAIVR